MSGMSDLDVSVEATQGPTPEPPLEPPTQLQPESRYLDRELSALDYFARVLALGADKSVPLLERVKFLAIFSQNLDEFFQVRVSGLQEQLDAGLRTTSPDGLDPGEQLRAIRARVEPLVARQASIFTQELAPALEEHGVRFCDWDELSDSDRARLDEVFEERIFPVLTPLAVDPAHPFPYISNLSLNLAVVVRDPSTGEERFARVKVPPLLPRFLGLPDGERFVPLEQVIAAHLDSLFPGMETVAHHPFRVTRDADFELSDDAQDLLEAMELILRRRTKFGRVVRLEVDGKMSDEVLELLCRELELGDSDVYVVDGPLGLSGLWGLYGLNRAELKDEPWTPQTQPVLARADGPPDLFRVLQQGDVLVHHPYDSFATSIEAFVEQASRDPDVLAIKQTLYRTAGSDSRVVRSLIHAAEQDKQVVALVELKARFDEQANIERAQLFEEAGIHVVYGLVGLKTHAKVLLVVRQEEDGIRRYVHIGTGNYNARTAATYEDIGLLSCDPGLGADVSDLFNYLTGYSRQRRFRELMVAPTGVRVGVLKLIGREAKRGGRIMIKVNNLVDPEIIDALYAAARAGAKIDLIVRGICCLRPGYEGLSENISVRSLVGRFLEHSRVFRFGPDDPAHYSIGSPALIDRNLDRRVEAVVPVKDAALRREIQSWLELTLADDTLAWALKPDGSWRKVPTVEGVNVHARLVQLALERAHGG